MNEKQYRGFEELDVWKRAREFRRRIYGLTKRLPPDERFVLLPQMRRAALSITNNIAEGHGRFHFQENIQFLRDSRGSLEEVLDDITLCEDEGYASVPELAELRTLAIKVEMLINGYIRYLTSQKQSNGVREESVPYGDTEASHESRATDHESRIPTHESP